MAKAFKDLIWDYIVFLILVVISTVIPLWSRFCGKKDKTKADYVFAMGRVSIFAMMLSIARGALGVKTFLGFPTELFYRGSAMWETLYGMVTAYPIVCYVFIPVYFSLGITSVYHYLDLRFKSRLVRCLASGTYIVRQVFNLGVTVFTPTVALKALIGIPIWASLLGITIISIIFNVLGGLKAAITADVIQGLTMVAVSVAIIIQATYEAGGISTVYTLNRDSGRLKFFQSDGDVTVRVDTVSAWLGQLFMSLSIFGCQQSFVQRYLSMDSIRSVTKTLMGNIPCIIVLFSISWVAGMAIYATYHACDPLAAGLTERMDDILSYFIEDKFIYLPGFIGLFIATLFNGSLSLNISNINSLATVTWEDFISQIPRFRSIKDSKQLAIIKLLGIVYGILIMGVGFLVSMLSGVIEGYMLMTSATSGPLLGVFLLAMLVPAANWKGAATGVIMSHLIALWMVVGNLTIDKPDVFLPTSIEGCSNDTLLANRILQSRGIYADYEPFNATTSSAVTEKSPNYPVFYAVSYMYYNLIGTLLTVFIGWAVSWMTASDEDAYDSKLLHPAVYRLSQWLPGKPRLYSNQVGDKDAKVLEDTTNSNGLENLGFEMKKNGDHLEADIRSRATQVLP